ncbi:MAG: T9SS type A sorting domain-containing protein [Dysgonamonadaceae bacterium]|jgi:hypothetical protein|nr:T9SS type A sorting domain-containing protein [Dysgonamonadaceae bacterium]
MRKFIFTSLFLSSLVFGLHAQTLATFEDGADDNLYLSDFGTSGDPFWYENALFVEGGLPQIGANPSKTGINTSDKSLFAINVANADWWGNFAVLGMKNPVTITEENRYLHVKVYRSIQPKNFRIGFNDREEAGEVFQGTISGDGKWESIVCDLGAKFMGEELQYIHIIWSTNWSDPREGWDVATYAFDDFVLSNSSLPPDVTLVDGNGLKIGYENQAETDQWVHAFDLLNENNTAEIIDNPFLESTVNSAGKILKFNKSDQASWWQGYRIDFNGIMEVGGQYPQYLHTLVYVPGSVITGDMMGVDIQLCAKDHLGNENNEIFTVWDDEVDEWVDLVMEINKIAYLKELTVRYDVRKDGEDWINSPANTFYLDEIAFNKDPEPRTHIETGIPQIASGDFAKIGISSGAVIVRTAEAAVIKLYNTLGGLVQSVGTNGTAVLPVEKGVYIVKINSVNGGQQIAKVLVK